RLDAAEIDAEPRDILLEGAVFRPGIEEQRLRFIPAPDRDEAGKAMSGAAQTIAGEHPLAMPPPSEAGKFGFDEGRRRGQAVGDIVDQAMELVAVDGVKLNHRLALLFSREAGFRSLTRLYGFDLAIARR